MKKNKNISLCSISFSKGFIPPNLPIATFYQEDKELNFIIDTGSDSNCIDANVVKCLKHDKIEGEVGQVTGVGGSQPVESCVIPFSSEDNTYKAEFLIADYSQVFTSIKDVHGIPIHGLLGSSFLRENNFVLDFKNMVASNDDISNN